MCNKSVISLIIIYLGLDFAHLVEFRDMQSQISTTDTRWDYFTFTQQWPGTMCKVWTDGSPNHHCNLPKNKDAWTIHGLWPTKTGTRGPGDCNSTWRFDPAQIKSIESELEQAWTNIHKETDKYDFWSHEWSKHGTCAAALESMNSELKYFSKCLELYKKYSMTNILSAANIHPSDTKPVTVDQLNKAIVSKLGKKPSIDCTTVGSVQYLVELRLCLDKQFKLNDCEGTLSNCKLSSKIIYPVENQKM